MGAGGEGGGDDVSDTSLLQSERFEENGAFTPSAGKSPEWRAYRGSPERPTRERVGWRCCDAVWVFAALRRRERVHFTQ